MKKNDPWNLNGGFGCMFCDKVFVKGQRPGGDFVEGVFAACVYPEEKQDPYLEFDADEGILKLSFLLSKKGLGGWCAKTPPKIGDEVKLEDGSVWKVSSVQSRVDWFEMEAKSC